VQGFDRPAARLFLCRTDPVEDRSMGQQSLNWNSFWDLATPERAAVALDVPIRDFFAPAGGGEAESPKHAALFSELLANARGLPLADLEMTVEIVGVVARRRGA
jgi:hypothetical protein